MHRHRLLATLFAAILLAPGAQAARQVIQGTDTLPAGKTKINANFAELYTAVGAAGTGTVTSVTMTVPNWLSLSGSPLTTSGTLALTAASETAHFVLVGPTSGSAAEPTFRLLVASDIPNLSASYDAAGTAAAITKSSLGLGSVENAAASALYVPLTRTVNGRALSGNISVTASDLSLGSVENAAASGLYVPLTRTINGSALSSNVTISTITGNAGTATALATARTLAITGDLAYTSPSFDGSGNVTAAGTLATVNSNTGALGSSTAIPTITTNAKGLVTAVTTNAVVAPAGTLTGSTLASGVTASSLTSTGKLASYNSITAEGNGVPAIVKVGRVTAQSAANASICTYTTPAADGSYEVSMNMNVTASTTLSTTMTCGYTDESNTARTFKLPCTALTGAFAAGGFANAVGAFHTPTFHIRCKASTSITLYTATGTFTGVTYTAEGIIKQTQ